MEKEINVTIRKKSFLIYDDTRVLVNLLSNEQAGILFKNIFRFSDNDELITMDEATNLVFQSIRLYLERDNEKYLSICKRRAEYGRLGGLKKQENIEKSLKEA